MKKISILMSGGVDSSVAAYLLLKEGYDVIGVTLKLWDCNSLSETQKQLCCSPKDVYDAKMVATQLGIKHYVLELNKEFENIVIKNFCNEYISGLTPNPCIECNSKIKFGIVLEKLKSMFRTDYIATGHYAKIVKHRRKYFVSVAKDKNKDQSYFLSQINHKMLKYIKFPLGEMTKTDVRKLAQQLGLKVAKKKDSFEICFVVDGNYHKFLVSQGYNIATKGKIVDINTGKFLGYHKGYPFYTIGQRSGLDLKNVGKKLYVTKIDSRKNIVYVGEEKDIYSNVLVAEKVVFFDNIVDDKNFFAKIRYKSDLAKCKITIVENRADTYAEVCPSQYQIKINFDQPQRAITPGQYVVVYDDKERIVCSGKIVKDNTT